MSNFDTVVLDGEMGLFTKVREGDLPYYTGATEVTPSDETQTLPTADTIVTSNITINPVPGEYIDTTDATLDDASLLPSGVTAYADGVKYTGTAAINDDGDLVVSGDTVTVPAGFYEEPAAASVESGSATTPSTSITANPSISVGNDGSITATVSATQSVTPTVSEGYVSSGTAGTITVSGSGSSQLSTQAGTTITPSTSQQTAVAAGKFTTGAVIVDAMPSGTAGTPTATKGTVSNHSVSVTPSVTNTTGYITGGTKTGTAVTVSASELVSGTKSITANGTNIDVTEYAAVDVAVPGDTPTLQTKSVSYTPTESAQSATVTADQGYDGLDEVNISVGAIDSEYVGSAIDRRDSTDLSASGATVTAPAGYYANSATKSVASGTAGTPSATKGAVSNHSVSVTPSVTNTAGYISGGTISGTAVTVDVTELESGTKSITENGTGISVSGYSAVDVNVSGGGGSEAEEKAVNFYDYDGTRVDSYTAQEFAALSALPANPSHSGLTAQGWNWSLADAKTYISTYPEAILNIGQMYTTVSGATEIDVTLDSLTLAPYLNICPNGTVTIDWGDNNTDTVTGTSLTSDKWTQHTYSAPGDYTIKLTATSGTYALYSSRTGNESTTIQFDAQWKNARAYASTIKAIRVGANVPSIGNFINLINLETISIPNTVTSVGRFMRCYSVKEITIPSGITTINPVSDSQSLRCIAIPNSVTSIPMDFAQNTYALESITIPSSVTTITNYAFRYAHGLKRILIPSGASGNGDGVFSGCRSLQSVKNKNSGLKPGGDFCRECFALEEIEFPSDITSVNGFYNCNSLEKVTIPASVTSIGNACFQNCYSMTEMHVLPTTPPTLGNNVSLSGFADNVVIYVPAESLSDYQSETNWSTWASKMQGE